MRNIRIVVAIIAVVTAGTGASSFAVTLPVGGFYSENFNTLGAGLPADFSVRTGATTSNLGTLASASFNSSPTSFVTSTGQFANYASASSVTEFASSTVQAASTDRALGVRQTGSFGDPGAAFVLKLDSTQNLSNFQLSLDLMLLSVQARSTTFSIDYGIGVSPTVFTSVGTFEDPLFFGTYPRTYSFAGALDNISDPVYLRIVALSSSSGSGSRDTLAIDNFKLTYSSQAIPEPTTCLFGAALLGIAALDRRRRGARTRLV